MGIGKLVARGACRLTLLVALAGDVTLASAEPNGGCGRWGCPCAAGAACIPNRANFGFYQGRWRRWPGVEEDEEMEQQWRRPAAPPSDLPAVQVPAPRDEATGGPRPGAVNPDQKPVGQSTPDTTPSGVDPPPLPPRDPNDAVPSLPDSLMRQGSPPAMPVAVRLWPNVDRPTSPEQTSDAQTLPGQEVFAPENRVEPAGHVYTVDELPGGLRVNPLRARALLAETPPQEKSPLARALTTPAAGDVEIDAQSEPRPLALSADHAAPASEVSNQQPQPLRSQAPVAEAPRSDGAVAESQRAAANEETTIAELPQLPQPTLSRNNPFRSRANTTTKPARESAPSVSEANAAGALASFDEPVAESANVPVATPAQPLGRRDGTQRYQVRIEPHRNLRPADAEPESTASDDDMAISSSNPLRSR